MYSINKETLRLLTKEEKEKVSEVRIPYVNQYQAATEIKEIAGRYNILFEVRLNYDNKEVIAKECAELLKIIPNIKFQPNLFSFDFLEVCKEHMSLSPTFPVDSIQEANSLFELGIKSFYVTGSLAANYSSLAGLKMKGIDLRIVPNLVQANSPGLGNLYRVDPFQCFWISPNIIDRYYNIVDAIVLSTGPTKREEGLMSIYTKGRWTGLISDFLINTGGKVSLDYLTSYPKELDEMKLDCGLICQQKGLCHSCLLIKLYTEQGKI